MRSVSLRLTNRSPSLEGGRTLAVKAVEDKVLTLDFNTDVVLLLGHGSRDATALEEFCQFARLFSQWSGVKRVCHGYMAWAAPSIPAAIDQAVVEGAKRIMAAPLFLFPGRHLLEDLPRLLMGSKEQHANTEIYYGEALSHHPKLLDLARIRIDPSKDQRPVNETALLVIGRGTREATSILAALEWTRELGLAYPHAVCCFAEVATPSISEGFERCVQLRATTVVIFPCLLFSGVVLKRIYEEISVMQRRYPELSIRTAGHFGGHPLLAEIVLEGIKESKPIGAIPIR